MGDNQPKTTPAAQNNVLKDTYSAQFATNNFWAAIPRAVGSWPFVVGFAVLHAAKEYLVGDMGDPYIQMQNENDEWYPLKAGLVNGFYDEAKFGFWNGYSHSELFGKLNKTFF